MAGVCKRLTSSGTPTKSDSSKKSWIRIEGYFSVYFLLWSNEPVEECGGKADTDVILLLFYGVIYSEMNSYY